MIGGKQYVLSSIAVILFFIPSLMIYDGAATPTLQNTNRHGGDLPIERPLAKIVTQGSPRVHAYYSLKVPKPVIMNVQTTGISDTSATITWDTDILSDSNVRYGLGRPPRDSWGGLNETKVTKHSVSLSGLDPATTYNYEVRSSSTGTGGGLTIDTNNGDYYTFTTTAPDTTPPVISNVQTTGVSDTNATITWGTDEDSTSIVNYGLSTALGSTESDTPLVMTHSVDLTGLTPDTTYYYEVESTDGTGNTANDGTYTFATNYPPVTTTPPPPPATTSPSHQYSTKLYFTSNNQFIESGTSEIDRTYRTWIKFVNTDNEDTPINSAEITYNGDIDKVDISGLNRNSGIYRIEIKPKELGTYFIKITAEKDQYNSASASLYLNVVPIETDLYFISNYQANELAMIKINETYTTIVQFNRTSITPETSIDGASINVFSSDPRVSYNISDLENGQYQITVDLNQSKQTIIDIMASKPLQDSDTVTLVLSSGLVETHLRFISTLKTTNTGTVQVYDIYTTIVQLNATVLSSELPIDSGNFEVHSSSLDLINTVIPLSDGLYQIDFEPTAIGQYNLDIDVSSGYGYKNTSASLTLIVEPIPTTLRINNSEFVDNQLSFIYTDPIEIVILYSDEKGGLICDNFEYETDGLDFNTYIEGNYTGEYIFSFEAPIPDMYHITITFYQTNYAVSSIVLNIVVNSIPIVNTSDNIAVSTEKDTKKLTVELINEIDGTPVTGATVTYSWLGGFGELEEQSNGIYVADLSNEELPIGSYSFYIIAEKANHVSLTLDYSLIVQDPEISPIVKFIGQYWLYITMIGGMAIGGTTRYIVKVRNKRREQTLIEEQKRQKLEYITDISHFNELLVISPSGIPFYSFAKSMNRPSQGINPDLYSSFLMAVKTFIGKTLTPENIEKTEDHFRFGSTEIFLSPIRELIFAYLFSAQVQDGEWKKVSHQVLEKCRELVIRIENDFQEAIKEFEEGFPTTTMPSEKISEIVIEMLSLDFISPHSIVDLSLYNEIGLLGERDIIQAIEQLDSEGDMISLPKIMDQLNELDMSPSAIIFVFNQLREDQAITSVTQTNQSAIELQTLTNHDDQQSRTASIIIDPIPKQRIVLIDSEEKRKFLEKLKALEDSVYDDESMNTT